MKLWCYNDAQHEWGTNLAQAATRRGIETHVFDDPRAPDEGYVFMHMHHHPSVRTHNKRAMAVMAMNPNLILVPEYRSSKLFDDKLEQARELARWMPPTLAFYSKGAALRHLAKDTTTYPFFSKSAEGSSSHNVRIIRNREAAEREIRNAFSSGGIACHYGQSQRGYLMWQKFIANNNHDIRILSIGNKRLVLKRGNRADRPMASGSGKLFPVRVLDDEVNSALIYSDKFFRDEAFLWCGIDLVKDKERWYVLETTVSWTMHGYYECGFFERDGKGGWVSSGRMGTEVWDVFIDQLESGAFDGGLK